MKQTLRNYCFSLTGNLLAVGTMEPFINIWDLDVIDAIDPVLTLGDKKKKKHKRVNQCLTYPFSKPVP